MSHRIIEVLVPIPINKTFFYKLPNDIKQIPKAGTRVIVDFNNRNLVGVVWGSRLNENKERDIKNIKEILDDEPVILDEQLELADWASRYYHYPLGEVISHFLTPSLRKGKKASFQEQAFWKLSNKGEFIDIKALRRAPKQEEALMFFRGRSKELPQRIILASGISGQTLKSLENKEILVKTIKTLDPKVDLLNLQKERKHKLTKEQEKAVNKICTKKEGVVLLNGITGSGKTEVYLEVIKKIIAEKKQALILIPEIGLAPQAEGRFKKRFGQRVASFHSAKNEKERLDIWLSMKKGLVDVVIGTRSSIFLPMSNLGIIVVDEEHDQSFKQMDRFRYSARELALYRAKINKIPIVLASATPSLESLKNALDNKYTHLRLTKRPGVAKLPQYLPVDLRGKELKDGLSNELIKGIDIELKNNNQVLIFLNRRGYASSLVCRFCGWVSSCQRCDAHMTVHRNPSKLHCHHCEASQSMPTNCPSCLGKKFESIGLGTERIESFLKKEFVSYPVIRIDSDSTRGKDSFIGYLETIKKGESAILLGTQMIAKGHHFPEVTLVGIVDADSGIFSADFRGSEKVAQIITQVAGRAGRGKKTGRVIIQTYCPEHPHIERLIDGNYETFAKDLLEERKAANSPPYSYQARIQTESIKSSISRDFLDEIWKLVESSSFPTAKIKKIGPLPSFMEKKQGVFRWEINLFSDTRKNLHKILDAINFYLRESPRRNKVRWTIDVDPYSTL